jgi:hypothetical protein
MGITTFEAIVENGQIRLPLHVRLPEKAKVYVVAPGVEVTPIASVVSPHLVHPEQAEDFKMEIVEENQDAGL